MGWSPASLANAAAPPPRFLPPKERFPEYALADGEEMECTEIINNSRVQGELGLSITPVKETIVDMAATLVQLDLAQPKPKGPEPGKQ